MRKVSALITVLILLASNGAAQLRQLKPGWNLFSAQQDVQNAFQQLYDSLTSAYWAASTIEDKDLIRGCADVVFQILSQLTVDDIKSRSADFQQLTNSVQSVTTKLQHLQSEIDGYHSQHSNSFECRRGRH